MNSSRNRLFQIIFSQLLRIQTYILKKFSNFQKGQNFDQNKQKQKFNLIHVYIIYFKQCKVINFQKQQIYIKKLKHLQNQYKAVKQNCLYHYNQHSLLAYFSNKNILLNIYPNQRYLTSIIAFNKMFQQIQDLIDKIKQHEHIHKVTIFNKQKNYQNMLEHNCTEGKLIQLLKEFPYFNTLNQNLGSEYLQKAIKYIEPYFLRKQKIFVNSKENNSPPEYLLIQGVLAVYQINNQIQNQKQRQQSPNAKHPQKHKKTLVFKQYLSNGTHIHFSDYKQNQFQLISKQNCQMIKLPNKTDLDPNQWAKSNVQKYRLAENIFQIQRNKAAIEKCIQQVRKSNQQLEIKSNYGLGAFDYNQFLSKGQIQKIPNHEKIYQYEQFIPKIGLILKGKIILENKKIRVNKFVSYDNAILTFYKKNFNSDPNKTQKNLTFLEQFEWIGLQQYLKHIQKAPFRVQRISEKESTKQNQKAAQIKQIKFVSQKQVRAGQQCEILWIPISKFSKKFNYQTNFTIVDQWRALIDIKQEAKQKNDKITQQLEKQRKQRQQSPQIQLPKLPKKLATLSHNIDGMERKIQFKNKIIVEKKRKFNQLYKKNVNISETSLLGITMRKYSDLDTIIQNDSEQMTYKKFSHFSRTTLSKKFDVPRKSILSPNKLKQKKILSEQKFQSHLAYQIQVDQTPQDLVMFPNLYQPTKLPPNLKKQFYLAERACRLQSASQGLLDKSKTTSLQNSQINSIQGQSRINNIPSIMGSKVSLNHSTISHSNPQMIYKGLAERISFKYPNLEYNLKAQKQFKRRIKNQTIQKISIKQRIQVLRMLEQNQRKKTRKQKFHLINSQLYKSEKYREDGKQIVLNTIQS